jgi:hypothetical protein
LLGRADEVIESLPFLPDCICRLIMALMRPTNNCLDECLLIEVERTLSDQCLRGLQVDHKLVLDWELDGKLARLRALQDAIGIGRRAPKIIEPVKSVGQQAAEFSELTVRIDGRETVASSQRCDLRAMDDQKESGFTTKPLFGSRACATTTDGALFQHC